MEKSSRQITVIESNPFSLTPMRRYILADDREREYFKNQYPDLNVRLADEDDDKQLMLDMAI